jgi:hypothetical protein
MVLVNASSFSAGGAINMSTACPPDPKILRYLLELPPVPRQSSKIGLPHEGGALVVDYIARKPEYSAAAGVKAGK